MKRRRIPIFLLALLLLSLTGCQSAAPKPYAYLDDSFSAELSGMLYSQAFTLKLTVTKDAPKGTASPTYSVTAEHLSPSPFAPLRLSAVLDQEGNAIGEVALTYGELHTTVSADTLTGLLCPIRALLVRKETVSVQKEGDVYRFVLENGATVVRNSDGYPLAFSSPDLSFSVVWWETEQKAEG